MTIGEFWGRIVAGDAARRMFSRRVEYILNEFGTALSCNRFAIGECIEYAATDFFREIGVRADAVSSEKRVDILVRNVEGLTELSSKFVSTGKHVVIYNAQRTVATDMSLRPTLLFLMDEWWLLEPSKMDAMGVSAREFLKSTGDSVQLSFNLLSRLRLMNYPYCLPHTIRYDKQFCPRKATSEILYRLVNDLLDPQLDPVVREYIERRMRSLQCRNVNASRGGRG
jgi:hypothetical protein